MRRQVSSPVRRGAGEKASNGPRSQPTQLPRDTAAIAALDSPGSYTSITAYARHNFRHWGVRQQYLMIQGSPPRMKIAGLSSGEYLSRTYPYTLGMVKRLRRDHGYADEPANVFSFPASFCN